MKDQQKFLQGLVAFEKKTDEQLDKSFLKYSPAERQALLKELEAQKTGNADLQYFYNVTKNLTIQAYTTSKFYLTKVQVYQLVPGRFKGCVPVKNAS